ncbi:MAG: M14-type cytosolic carboxypeptidase [Pseudomonadota bacterium]
MISVTSDFDNGNIRVIDAADPAAIRLEIAPDGEAAFHQWFYYRVAGAKGRDLVMNIENAGKSSYVGGWKGYNAVASYDGETWFRIDTGYADGVLTMRHRPEQDEIAYAYFAAYPAARVDAFAEEMRKTGRFGYENLGESLDGQALHYFQVGEGPLNFWVIARQHPGETMGSWWMEGFLRALADGDPVVGDLLTRATLHIVPCMNPDGAKRGHLRTNAAGVDLNRAWRNTTPDKSPEVFHVREKMRATGVDFFLDVHGDEAIPNNFLDSAEGVPVWDDRQAALFRAYSDALLKISSEFQTKDGYPASPPGKANLDIANKYVAETWRCLSMTLEMPFKDADVNPDPDVGWSPARCANFAREHLRAMAQIVGEIG